MRGKFLVLYGSNNSGKSEQIRLLAEYLQSEDKKVQTIKYPIYESETGKIINAALREGFEISDNTLQWVYAEDRAAFEPTLAGWLEQGYWVVAEDYIGTGLAWGLTKGVDREWLNAANRGLLQPDWSLLIDNEHRFTSGIEKNHRFESAGDEMWDLNRRIHLELAREFGWEVVERTGMEAEETHLAIVDRLIESGLL